MLGLHQGVLYAALQGGRHFLRVVSMEFFEAGHVKLATSGNVSAVVEMTAFRHDVANLLASFCTGRLLRRDQDRVDSMNDAVAGFNICLARSSHC